MDSDLAEGTRAVGHGGVGGMQDKPSSSQSFLLGTDLLTMLPQELGAVPSWLLAKLFGFGFFMGETTFSFSSSFHAQL